MRGHSVLGMTNQTFRTTTDNILIGPKKCHLNIMFRYNHTIQALFTFRQNLWVIFTNTLKEFFCQHKVLHFYVSR